MFLEKIKNDKIFRNLLIIALFYAALLFLFISKYDFNISSTVQLSANHLHNYKGTIPDSIVRFDHDGFDGQYNLMMALNPSLEKIHIGLNFYQRIVYPVIVNIFSLGIPEVMPYMMVFINFAAVILSSYLIMFLLRRHKANINLVFLWAFCVSPLICFTKDLSELLMVLFILLTICLFEKNKHILASICLALAILTREIALPIYAAILLYFLIKCDWKKLFIYTLAVIPFGIWDIILFYKLGTLPIIASYWAISEPITSLLNYFKDKPREIELTLNTIKDHIPTLINNPSSINTNMNAISTSTMTVINTTTNTLPRTNILYILRDINLKYSSIPILFFSFFQLILIIWNYIKDKKITVYSLILLSQIALIFSLSKGIFSNGGIDALGRYAICLFLFSILYTTERQQKYSKILAIISTLISAVYFMIIIFIK